MIDNDDCSWTFALLGELVAGVAESLSGFEFGVVSSSSLTTSVFTATARTVLEDTTEGIGGTALKLANWAIFSRTSAGPQEILADSPTIGTATTQVVPVAKTLGLQAGKVLWNIEAPAVKLRAEEVAAYLSRQLGLGHGTSEAEALVYSPIEEWSDEWEANLFEWWGSKPEGQNYAYQVGCPQTTPQPWNPTYTVDVCAVTGEPILPPNPPTATRAEG